MQHGAWQDAETAFVPAWMVTKPEVHEKRVLKCVHVSVRFTEACG